MDWKISFAPTMSLEIRVEPVPKTKIPILVDGFLFGAKVRQGRKYMLFNYYSKTASSWDNNKIFNTLDFAR